MKITMSKADLVGVQNVLALIDQGIESSGQEGLFEAITGMSIQDVLQKRIVDDGIGVITYTEDEATIDAPAEKLELVYAAMNPYNLGMVLGLALAAFNAGAAYVAHTSETLEDLENSVKPERPPSKLGIVRPPKFRAFKT